MQKGQPAKSNSSSKGISYRYAKLEDSNQILDVFDLNRDEVDRSKSYICIGCSRVLIPRLGEKVTKHFAHKAADNCSFESYLHKLGKTVLYRRIKKNLQLGLPFYVPMEIPYQCTEFQGEYGIACSQSRTEQVNLLAYFDKVELEKGVEGVVPDVLLSNKDGELLFLEIAVTHECEEEKIQLGIRIIEVVINSESDLDFIKEQGLDFESVSFKYHNIDHKVLNQKCYLDKCTNRYLVFYVYGSGKAFMKEEVLAKVAREKQRLDVQYMRVISSDFPGVEGKQIFVDHVRKAHFEGADVKNCFLCRYHGLDGIYEPIFCKYLKKSCGSNVAADCSSYRKVKTTKEIEAIDKANQKYLRSEKYSRSMVRKFFLGR